MKVTHCSKIFSIFRFACVFSFAVAVTFIDFFSHASKSVCTKNVMCSLMYCCACALAIFGRFSLYFERLETVSIPACTCTAAHYYAVSACLSVFLYIYLFVCLVSWLAI